MEQNYNSTVNHAKTRSMFGFTLGVKSARMDNSERLAAHKTLSVPTWGKCCAVVEWKHDSKCRQSGDSLRTEAHPQPHPKNSTREQGLKTRTTSPADADPQLSAGDPCVSTALE